MFVHLEVARVLTMAGVSCLLCLLRGFSVLVLESNTRNSAKLAKSGAEEVREWQCELRLVGGSWRDRCLSIPEA